MPELRRTGVQICSMLEGFRSSPFLKRFPLFKISHRGDDCAGGENVRQIVVAADKLAVLPLVPLRAVLDEVVRVAVARRSHPQRLEDALGDELPVTLSRHLLNNVAEKAVVDIPVAVCFAGRKTWWVRADAFDEL